MKPRLPNINACGIGDVPVVFTTKQRGHILVGQDAKTYIALMNEGKLVLRPNIAHILSDFNIQFQSHNFHKLGDFISALRADLVDSPMPCQMYNFDNLLRMMKRREQKWSWSAESAQCLTDYVWLLWVLLKTIGSPQEKFYRLENWDKKCENPMAQLSALLSISTGGELSGLNSFKQWTAAVLQFERSVCDVSEQVSL